MTTFPPIVITTDFEFPVSIIEATFHEVEMVEAVSKYAEPSIFEQIVEASFSEVQRLLVTFNAQG